MKKIKPEFLLALVALVIIGGALGGAAYNNHQKNEAAKAAKTKSEKADKAKKEQLDKLDLPQLSKTVGKDETKATIKTTEGDIIVKLFDKQAPLAVENFVKHAKDGYYDGTTVHRVVKDFMIQAGDPDGTGQGGHSIWYKKDKNIDSGNGFKNEISDQLYNIRGALSMANAGPDTNGSQFFINQNKDDQTKDIKAVKYPQKIYDAYKKGGYPSLDGNYTVFGQVIDGMDTVDKIANVKVEENDNQEKSKPIDKIEIKSIEID